MAIKGFGKAEAAKLRELELKYNLKLPKDYSDFLMQYNGGRVDLEEGKGFFVEDLAEMIYIEIMFGVNTGNSEIDVDSWTDDYSFDMPPGALIIGYSLEHGFIVLFCEGEDTGIFYWDHSYEFESSSDDGNTYFMTRTFSELVRHML